MALLDWLCLGGTEIANAARTIAYARNGLKPHTMTVRDCYCSDLPLILGDGEYRLPVLDTHAPPPWLDHAVPESYEFAGLLVTGVEGLDAAPVERPVVQRLGDGAVAGRRRYGPRTIVVTGILLGSTCCGIDYGMRWLASALRGSMACGPGGGCSGDDLRYLSCCPEVCEDAPAFTTVEDCAAPHWRTLRDVTLIDGPKVTGAVGASCGCCQSCPPKQVEFTLLAGRPHALRDPITVTAPGETWTEEDPEAACVTWSNDPDCVATQDGCEPVTVSCLDVALAGLGCAPTAPPDLPVPGNPCACEPLSRRRHCIDIPSSVLTPIWSDVVPDIEIYAGGNALRSVRVRFYPNPLGRTIEELEECGWCAEVNVTVIPEYSTLRIDGTRRRVTVTCPGSPEAPAGAAVTGTGGMPYTWPVLDCGVPYIACVEAASGTIAPDATITIRVISREV
ncbi:hypothetical protein [Thermomonospora cellulosilytica]|uniref:Uncharacterized protein n=1 Tax=Thermomonospora cellulosilytica TaxID=1411118 RepID=A0A7W3RAI9_9ACTN|nr:hypothetical protein [Thermomonospora cellulosilytica]MBA9005912.1 hypothetical protein [Thermomonospora cellulosilytica]